MNRQIWLLMLLFAFTARPLHATFILDDFDDPAEVISPEMKGISVTTINVGALSATRSISIVSSRTDPSGSIDISVTAPSTLTAQFDHASPISTLTPIITYQIDYSFAPADLTENGHNNAILFDFESFTGNHPPLLLRLILRDETTPSQTYEALITELQLSTLPFALSMPFDSFALRGGSPGTPDFSAVTEMNFDLFDLGDILNSNWTAKINSIRVGRIPEPDMIIPIIIAGLFLTFKRPSNPWRGSFQKEVCHGAYQKAIVVGNDRNHRNAVPSMWS